jgi:pimeloyl-ACP methyl ester carboxylesterase
MTRWAERETVDDWSQGTPLAALRELVRYWREEYDWRRCGVAERDRPVHRPDGLPIHFLHVRSRHENATPLVLTHGWPGSILEFRNCIAALTDPEAHGGTADDAFHVVIPRCRASAFRASRRRPAGVSKGSGGPGAN